MKNYKFWLVNFISYLATLVKPLGFAENVIPFLKRKAVFDIECMVFEFLRDQSADFWSEIFKRNKQLAMIDRKVLSASKKLTILWRLRYLMILLVRSIFIVLDILKILLIRPPIYYLAVNISGKINSKKKFFCYTNNRSRQKIFSGDGDYCLYDILITKSAIDGYELVKESKLSVREKVKCLRLKLRFPYINSDFIWETIASKALFTIGFNTFLYPEHSAGAFNREGTTSKAKMFLYTAGEAGISRNVIYTMPAITENVLFPRACDNLVLISDVRPYFVPKAVRVKVLGDNPYLKWREIGASSPIRKVIGVLLGDEFNRWAEQEIVDKTILEKLKSMGCDLCLARPHPQELTRPVRVKYYNKLVKQYPFLRLEVGEPEKFLSDISVLIVYAQSTMVQEALLCNRPIIEYRTEQDFSPNRSVLEISKDLGSSISNIDYLDDEMEKLFKRNKRQRDLNWMGFLNNLKFKNNISDEIDRILGNLLVRPVTFTRKKR